MIVRSVRVVPRSDTSMVAIMPALLRNGDCGGRRAKAWPSKRTRGNNNLIVEERGGHNPEKLGDQATRHALQVASQLRALGPRHYALLRRVALLRAPRCARAARCARLGGEVANR